MERTRNEEKQEEDLAHVKSYNGSGAGLSNAPLPADSTTLSAGAERVPALCLRALGKQLLARSPLG
jgi:hypothetical protein